MDINSVQLSIGPERGSYNDEEVKSFLKGVTKAGMTVLTEHISPEKLTHFVQGKISETDYDLDYAHTVEVLNDLREKIAIFEDKGLTSLFEDTVGIVNSIKMEKLKEAAEEVPVLYIGDTTCWTIIGNFEKEDTGTFMVYSLWSEPSLLASTKLKSGRLLTYSLKSDPSNKNRKIIDEVYFLSRTNGVLIKATFTSEKSPVGEKFDSIEDFIESQIGKGKFKIPFKPSKRFDFEKETAKYLKREPYFPDFDHTTAVNYLNTRNDGTFLIRNKETDKNTQVIMYVQDGDVKRLELTPGKEPFKGYEFDDKWYSTLEKLILFNSEVFKTSFTLSLEEVEASLAIEKMHKEVEELEVEPQWKGDVYEMYRKRVKSGKEPINKILADAFGNGEFEVVKWLINKDASLESLESIVKSPTHEDQLSWLKKYAENPEPKPRSLNHYGLDVGYGFKSANLMVQKRYVNELNEQLKVAKAQVPPFIPISDFEIQNHLATLMPKIEEFWNKFLNTFEPEMRKLIIKGEIDPVAIPIKIAPEGQVILETIQTEIKRYFLEIPYDTPELQDWMRNNPSEFLIIRSTGKEDTEDNPNPGGNETIPYVKPEAYQISNSIAQVVSSYFGIKSVTQRLMVGDKTVFTEKPFMPVLVMNMVTENVNGEGSTDRDIPRSGVMFTRQEGKAEGVTLLQVGLGNNEGVVGSKVAVDTHYIDENGNINTIIRDKKTRFIPLQAGESAPITVGPMDNKDPDLEVSQGLSDPMVMDMKIAADFFADKYRKGEDLPPAAMDMEYTIQLGKGDANPVISLLQIRPLVEKEVTEPSYLTLARVQEIGADKKVAARTLLGGSSSVEDITSLDDVMFVDNLSQGLSRYLKTAYKKVKVKAPEASLEVVKPPKVIFTRKTAHLTSHEAIFFRKRGVVVFVIDDSSQMERLKKMVGRTNEENPIKADPQRGVLVDTYGYENREDLVTGGFISYPIPREITLPKGLFHPISKTWKPKEIEIKLQILNERYQKLDNELMGRKKYHGSDVSNRELFDIVATASNPEDAKRALGTMLRRLNADLKERIAKTEEFRADVNLPLLQIFDAATLLTERQILPALSQPPGHPNRLFALKFLDAHIFQEQSQSVVGSQSWRSVKGVDVAEKRAIETAGAYGVTIEGERADWQVQLQKMGNLAFNNEIRINWTKFTKELIKASEENPKVLALAGLLIREVVDLGLATDWVNLVFNPTWTESTPTKGRSVEVLKKLVQIYATDRETIDWVKENRVKLSRNREQIGEWSNPKFTRKNIQKLRNEYSKTYGFLHTKGTSPFAERFKASDKMGRLALLEFYREAIDIYDKSLKSISGSNEYPEDNITMAKDFSKLLVGYFNMFKGTVHMITEEDEKVMMYDKGENDDATFDSYLEDMEHGVIEILLSTKGGLGLIQSFQDVQRATEDQSDQFEACPEFNVEALAIGSHADYMYHIVLPHTLEEFFTTTHQNLERVRMHLVTKVGLNSDVLEGTPKNISAAINRKFRQQPSSVSMSGSLMSVRYNIPLRQHSSSIELQFDVNKPEKGVTIIGETFGHNEKARWDKTVGFAAMFGNISGNDFTIPPGSPPVIDYQNPNSCKFTWHVPVNTKPRRMSTLMGAFNYIFKVISFRTVNKSQIFSEIEYKLPEKDWHNVNESAYEDTLHYNTYMMEYFANKGNPDLVLKVAKGALEGLIKYGLDDYRRGGKIPHIPGYRNNPEYSYVPGNDGKTENSLKLTATLYLIKGLVEDRSNTEPVVRSLLENPQFMKKFPDTAEALHNALK